MRKNTLEVGQIRKFKFGEAYAVVLSIDEKSNEVYCRFFHLPMLISCYSKDYFEVNTVIP